jgi:signal transduction histidine kinase
MLVGGRPARDGPLPSGTEDRVAAFAELVSTAISNVEARLRVEQLAAEQSALRRVAELVAQHAPAEQIFVGVNEELAELLGVDMVRTVRFELDGTATIVAARGMAEDPLPPGTNAPISSGTVIDQVSRTSRPARVDDYAEKVGGPIATRLGKDGGGSAAGGPIVVDGRVWGAMVVCKTAEALPAGTEDRVARFAELVSTAISNLESREQVERLAAEQSALRRVAEVVARQAPRDEVFAVVIEEMSRLLGVDMVRMARFEPDGGATVLATRAETVLIPPGTSIPIPEGSAMGEVFRTGGAARVEDYARVPGRIGEVIRAEGARCGAAGPIVVEGRVWGALSIGSSTAETLPPGAEERIAQFAELVSTAISNIEWRCSVERLASEQSALRRVAELVAREHAPDDLFATLAEEVRVLLGVDASEILRYEDDATATMVAGWTETGFSLPIGERLPLDGENLAAQVKRTGAPARLDDYSDATGAIAALSREVGVRSAVASPIVVEGATWGVIAVACLRPRPLPPDTEARLAEFSRVAAMAVANAKSRYDLAESRARIVRAGDEARRGFERDLHDGAQQRLVSLGLELRAAEATVPDEMGDLRRVVSRVATGLNEVLDGLRELSRGLHPAVLSEDGLSPALHSLALRSAVPVVLRVELDDERFEEPVEVAAYYVASEALTNAAKHASASRAELRIGHRDGWLELTVSDDGRGGADATRGSGLTGLVDRVEALGGTIQIDSVPGVGTTIDVRLPAATPAAPPLTATPAEG